MTDQIHGQHFYPLHLNPSQFSLSPSTIIPVIYIFILNKLTQVSLLSVHKDSVLTPSSSAGLQPILQRREEGWSSECRGRGQRRRGRRGGRHVRLTTQSCRTGRSVPLFSDAVTGGVSVSAAHRPNLWLPLLLHQHLPAQYSAGER